MIKIDKNVPLPSRAPVHGSVTKALASLEVGDSFELDHYASGSLTLYVKNNPGTRFTRRRDPETGRIRVWRVA